MAPLGSFRSHATGTLVAHVSEVKFMRKYGEALGLSQMLALGSFSLYHHGGMLQSLMVLMHSTELAIEGDSKAHTVYLDSPFGSYTVQWV